MSLIHHLLRFDAVEALGWTLVHFLWQGALLWMVYGVAARVCAVSGPGVRHGLALGALILALTLPTVTFFTIVEEHPLSLPVVEAVAAAPLPTTTSTAEATNAEVPGGSVGPMIRSSFWSSWYHSLGDYLKAAVPAATVAWFLGVVWHLGLLYRDWMGLRCLHRVSEPLQDGIWDKKLEALAAKLNLSRRVDLRFSDALISPVSFGWLKPVIVVPLATLSGLPSAQMEMVLAHELAHIRRGDYLINWLQCLAETMLFFHPVIGRISSDLRTSREECADDLAVRIAGKPVDLAHALLSLAECSHGRLAAAASGGSLLQRVRRLLEGSPAPARVGSWASLMTMTALVITICWTTYRLGWAASSDDELVSKTLPAPFGKVVDARGNPLVGAKVWLYHQAHLPCDDRVVSQVETAEDGSFRFEKALLFHDANVDTAGEQYVVAAKHETKALGTLILSKQDKTDKPLRLTLLKGKSCTVRVINRQKQPLAGAKVWLGHTDGARFRFACGILEGRTGADGWCTVNNIPDGNFSLYAKAEGYWETWTFDGQIKTLAPEARASGLVLDPLGKPLANAAVIIWTSWEQEPHYGASQDVMVRTDANGKFVSAGLYGDDAPWPKATGDYMARPMHPDWTSEVVRFHLASGGSVDNLVVKAVPGTSLKVKFVDAETQVHVPGALIQANVRLDDPNARASYTVYATTDTSGTCSFRFPNAAEVDVFGSGPPEGYYWDCEPGDHDRETFAATGVARNVTLQSPGRVLPLVGLRGRLSPPLPGCSVVATVIRSAKDSGFYLESGRRGSQGHRSNSEGVKSGADGSFVFHYQPGARRILITAKNEDETLGGKMEVRSPNDGVAELDQPLALEKRDAVRVVIVDENGKALSKTSVTVRRTVGSSTASDNDYTTDDKGEVSLKGILPGTRFEFHDGKIYQRNVDLSGAQPVKIWMGKGLRVRAVDAAGRPLKIEKIAGFEATYKNGIWSNGKVDILERADNGEHLLDRQQFVLARPGPMMLECELGSGEKTRLLGNFPGNTGEVVQLVEAPFQRGESVPAAHTTRIEGILVDSEGATLAHTKIMLSPNPFPVGVFTGFTTDAEGRYSIPCNPGLYGISIPRAGSDHAYFANQPIKLNQVYAIPAVPTVDSGN